MRPWRGMAKYGVPQGWLKEIRDYHPFGLKPQMPSLQRNALTEPVGCPIRRATLASVIRASRAFSGAVHGFHVGLHGDDPGSVSGEIEPRPPCARYAPPHPCPAKYPQGHLPPMSMDGLALRLEYPQLLEPVFRFLDGLISDYATTCTWR